MNRNSVRTVLWLTIFMIVIGWLLLVWVPMAKRDNEIDPQKVLHDSQTKIDEVRSKLDEIQMQDADASKRGR